MYAALAEGLWSPDQADLGAPYVAKYVEASPALAARRSPGYANVIGSSFPRLWLEDTQLDLLRSGLAGDVPTVLRRKWDDELDGRRDPISAAFPPPPVGPTTGSPW